MLWGRSGMLEDAQVSLHDSTAHAQRFSHPSGEADDCDIIFEVTVILFM